MVNRSTYIVICKTHAKCLYSGIDSGIDSEIDSEIGDDSEIVGLILGRTIGKRISRPLPNVVDFHPALRISPKGKVVMVG